MPAAATATATAAASAPEAQHQPEPRMRLRDLVPNLFLGDYAPGPLNSLTDVAGVRVQTDEIRDAGGNVNTGVTAILPRADWATKACYAGLFRFNGAGEVTGSHWIAETGLLHSPVVLTGSFGVGAAHQGVYQFALDVLGGADAGRPDWGLLPVVAETYDGLLSDVTRFALRPDRVAAALHAAAAAPPGAPVREGNTGGGHGMVCHRFKGGTGSSSRVVHGSDLPSAGAQPRAYTVGALVQANYGRREDLRIAGVPIGRILAAQQAAEEEEEEVEMRKRSEGTAGQQDQEEQLKAKRAAARARDRDLDRKDGSIIVVLATDAPLHPAQLQRLARRATVGLARAGGTGNNMSGDIFLALSTGNEVPVQGMTPEGRAVDPWKPSPFAVHVVDDGSINGLLSAAADAAEEAIYNALCMAETMVGNRGERVEALPLRRVRDILERYTADRW